MTFPVYRTKQFDPCARIAASVTWNPLQSDNVTINNNYRTVRVDTLNSNGYVSGVTQLELRDGKYYWEIRVDELDVSAGPGTAYASIGVTDYHVGITGSMFSSEYRSDKAVQAWWNSNGSTLLATHLSNGVTVTTTGMAAWTKGDVLQFALDLAAGKMWLGANGTWFNSGNPAAGTGQQVSGLTNNYPGSDASLSEPGYQIAFVARSADYVTYPVQITGRFLASEQTYAAPSGFTASLPVPTTNSYSPFQMNGMGGFMEWNIAPPSATFWNGNGTNLITDSEGWGVVGGRMFTGGKYYWEMNPSSAPTINDMVFGIKSYYDSASWTLNARCMWQGGGTLTASSGITIDSTGVAGFAQGDRLMGALDLVNGTMWVGKNNAWFNSGNPATNTNPQFSGILSDASIWVARAHIKGNSRAWFGYHPATQYSYSAPSGFHKGIPMSLPQSEVCLNQLGTLGT